MTHSNVSGQRRGHGRGLIIAAPTSGSGKTIITLGILRALKRRGIPVSAAKSGPDYIDPRFHQAASGHACVNLDAWAMSPARLRNLAETDNFRIIEGAMGLFDGAPPDGKGSVADLARLLDLPVILVVDAARMAQSVVPLVQGFSKHDPKVHVAGVILNKVGSDKHARILTTALQTAGVDVFGVVRRDTNLTTPSRHLGLVQAQELPELNHLLDAAANTVESALDLDRILDMSGVIINGETGILPAPTGKRIAIAQDAAFDFTYPHLVSDIRASGAEISFFSPLKNEAVPKADMIYLPGGYPELFAAQLANNSNFMGSLRKAAEDTEIYGECGGYMVLGDHLIDADGARHEMAGLLPLETSFADRKLHLGYRLITARDGWLKGHHNAHEFHYATTVRADGEPLFTAQNAEGTGLPAMGLRKGCVCGSFAHIIDRACPSDAKPLPLFHDHI